MNNKSSFDEFTMGIDGDVINYDAVCSANNIGGMYGNFKEDLALSGDDDEFYGGDGDYSNAGGLMSKIFGSGYEKRRDAREKRRFMRQKLKAEAKKTKAGAKLETAKS